MTYDFLAFSFQDWVHQEDMKEGGRFRQGWSISRIEYFRNGATGKNPPLWDTVSEQLSNGVFGSLLVPFECLCKQPDYKSGSLLVVAA